jgi:hypothetical protein
VFLENQISLERSSNRYDAKKNAPKGRVSNEQCVKHSRKNIDKKGSTMKKVTSDRWLSLYHIKTAESPTGFSAVIFSRLLG